MPVRRSFIIFAILLLGLPFGAFAVISRAPQGGGGAGAGGNGNNQESNLQFHVVSRDDVVSVVSAVGKVEPDESVDISFTQPGRIAEVFVDPANYVEQGDLLLRLENDNQRIAYDRAYLNLELAEIELDDLQAPVDADDVRIAEANVDAAWGTYQSTLNTANRSDIEAADLRVDQAQAALDAAIDRRRRGGNFSEEEEVTLADAEIGEASFNLEIARLQAQDLRTGNPSAANAAYLGYVQAQAELDRVLAGPRPIDIEQAEVRIRQAQAQVNRAEADLLKTEVRAPFSGYVTDVYYEVGTLIGPNQPVVQMVDIDPLSLTVQIDEIDIGQIQPGMTVQVEVDALPDVILPARLEKIALTGRQTAGGIVNYDAEIQLDVVDSRVRVGMTAEANVVVNEVRDVVVVPNAYIKLDRQLNEAFVQVVTAENELEERKVTLGLRGQSTSEITSGIDEGDIIAADLSGNQFNLFGG